MSRLSESQSRGQAHHRAAQGSPTFAFGAATIPCVVSTLTRGTVIELGGIAVEISLSLIARRSAITGTVPTVGKTVTYGGTIYRVVSVGEPMSGSIKFDLGSANR